MYEILTGCPLFQGLGAEKIRELLENKEYSLEAFEDGQLIAERETAYSGLMILLEGEVRGESHDRDGRRHLIDRITAPQLIAPAFLFGGYNRLPMDIVAQGPVTILTLHRGLLFELMQDNIIIMSNFIDVISNRANLLSRKIYFLSFKTLREKIANYLLAESAGGENSVPFADLNRMAEYFDSPRHSIVEVIRELEKHSYIDYDGHRIGILNREALEKI